MITVNHAHAILGTNLDLSACHETARTHVAMMSVYQKIDQGGSYSMDHLSYLSDSWIKSVVNEVSDVKFDYQ